jgi:hypothetical protein
VLEELFAGVVDGGDGGVGFEVAAAGDLSGEVFARVEIFEEAGDGLDVIVEEFYATGLHGGSQSTGSDTRRKSSHAVEVLTMPSSNLSQISFRYGLLDNNA